MRWRGRAAAIAAATFVCASFAALLLLASRTITLESETARGVEVFISPREARPPRVEAQRPRTNTAPVADARPTPTASVETQMLRRMLGCVRRPGERPREGCPSEPAAEDWARPRIAVGGDFAPPPSLDLNRAFTRAEQATLAMPPCEGACFRVGPTPPPPSRSAEELCEMEGIGPCRPPPETPQRSTP